MATIKQIAELAGVSRGTVDRVLNNRGSVNANTAARVREIADKLNYKPNKAGLMLAAQKKNLKIGVILFPDSNPFFSEVLEGVNAKAKELSAYNFTVLIRQVPFDETEQFNTMEALLADQRISYRTIQFFIYCRGNRPPHRNEHSSHYRKHRYSVPQDRICRK